MATVSVIGNVVVLKSAIGYEDMELVKKYKPDALTLKDAETKEPIFAIGVGSVGRASEFGITFNGKSNTDGKCIAVLTEVKNFEAPIEEFVADYLGTAIINLEKIEATFDEVVSEIKSERDNIISHITVE